MKSKKQQLELKKKYSKSKKYHQALHDPFGSQPPVDKIVKSFNEKFDILVLIDHAAIPRDIKLKTITRQILEVLKQALGKRILQIIPMVVSHEPIYQLKEKKSNFKLEQKRLLNATSSVHDLKFGLNLNSDHIFETIIKGPAGDSPEAKEFRDFWGEKSKLGGALEWGQICEFVNWKPEELKHLNLADYRAITGRIIRYILTTKFSFERKYIRITGNELDRFLSPCKIPPPDYGTGEERLKEISIAFDGLSKKLRSLSSLPLAVAKIQGVSPCLRGTHPFPPKKCEQFFSPHFYVDKLSCKSFKKPSAKFYLTPYIEPVHVVFGMEASGKWPNELEAFRKTKTAFYIEMSEQLAKQYGIKSKVNPNYLDALYDEVVFRVQLSCNKELTLLRQIVNEKGMIETMESEEANILEKLTIHLPIISSAINGVHTRFFNYSFTCRIVKRWLSCHLLLDHIDEVALELIVAHLFTNPYPQITPLSPLCGFIRFLKLMKSFKWQKKPLILNFNGELKQQDIDEINANFQVRRKSLPLIFIATQYDKFNSIWTKDKPTAPILRRIIFLSDKCYNYLQTQLNSVGKFDFLPLFHTNRDIFDITINLNKKIMPSFCLGLNFVKFKSLESFAKSPKRRPNNLEGFPIVDFDPVKYYIRDLKANFDEFALIFHDRFGGLKIFLAWKPNALNPKPLLSHDVKYFKSTGTITESGKSNIVLDVEAVLKDLKALGRGLVTSISVNNVSNWNVR
ncbi:nucleolar protein 6 Mat89Ba [Brevipalpus obovatus]|uniref:nucleolar protein 6 Mat89Ba n=1 Tax=Brevipalpus obovatus TaxID=246614 RepID=UPI003D9E960B